MTSVKPDQPKRIACDAMCGGLARWLRVLGVDASYTPGIDDAELVRHAQSDHRVLISSDRKIFERRLLASGEVQGLLLPVGLALRDQVKFAVAGLGLAVGFPRCTLCNGELQSVDRAAVADVVPAKSLIWAPEFYRCQECQHVYWEGTHWRRIRAVREELGQNVPPTLPASRP